MSNDRSYEHYLRALAHGRGGKKAIARGTVLTKRDDDTLDFTLGYYDYRGSFLELRPNDEFTFVFPDNRMYTNTLYNRVHAIAGINLYHNRARGVSQPLRVAMRPEIVTQSSSRYPFGYYWKWPSIPYVHGLRCNCDGHILNPEIAVDYVTRLNFEKARPFRKSYTDLHKLLRVAARMQLFPGWGKDGHASEYEFANVNWREPTMADAELVYKIGRAYGGWSYRNNPDYEVKYLKNRAESGLRKFREWLYETHGCYEKVPLTDAKE